MSILVRKPFVERLFHSVGYSTTFFHFERNFFKRAFSVLVGGWILIHVNLYLKISDLHKRIIAQIRGKVHANHKVT